MITWSRAPGTDPWAQLAALFQSKFTDPVHILTPWPWLDIAIPKSRIKQMDLKRREAGMNLEVKGNSRMMSFVYFMMMS